MNGTEELGSAGGDGADDIDGAGEIEIIDGTKEVEGPIEIEGTADGTDDTEGMKDTEGINEGPRSWADDIKDIEGMPVGFFEGMVDGATWASRLFDEAGVDDAIEIDGSKARTPKLPTRPAWRP